MRASRNFLVSSIVMRRPSRMISQFSWGPNEDTAGKGECRLNAYFCLPIYYTRNAP